MRFVLSLFTIILLDSLIASILHSLGILSMTSFSHPINFREFLEVVGAAILTFGIGRAFVSGGIGFLILLMDADLKSVSQFMIVVGLTNLILSILMLAVSGGEALVFISSASLVLILIFVFNIVLKKDSGK